MNRRGALRSLLGAPFAATAATKAAAAAAEGVGMLGSNVNSVGCDEPHMPSSDPVREFLRRKLIKLSPYRPESRVPLSISTKKSWSDCFKQHVANRRADEYHHFDRLLDEASYSSDPLTKANALAALVKRFGSGDG